MIGKTTDGVQFYLSSWTIRAFYLLKKVEDKLVVSAEFGDRHKLEIDLTQEEYDRIVKELEESN